MPNSEGPQRRHNAPPVAHVYIGGHDTFCNQRYTLVVPFSLFDKTFPDSCDHRLLLLEATNVRLLQWSLRTGFHVLWHLDVLSTRRHFVRVWILLVEVVHRLSASRARGKHGEGDGEAHGVFWSGLGGPQERAVDASRVPQRIDPGLSDRSFFCRIRNDVTGPNQHERRVGEDDSDTEAEEGVLNLGVLRGDDYGEAACAGQHRDRDVPSSFFRAIGRDGNSEDADDCNHVDL